MKTIHIQVPHTIAKQSSKLTREDRLELLRNYKKDQEDILAVKEEMKKPQQSISLSEYLRNAKGTITE